jgi:hypothetical protein
MEDINGVSLETLADVMSKDGELRAKFGEQQGRAELASFLASKGLSQQAFSVAHNAWWERFRSDPSGMLEAQFHQMLSQRTMKAHYADVPDMSGDQIMGVTLDTYAQLCVAMSKPGIDAEAVARAHGLPDAATWTQVNQGWTAKMTVDKTGATATQFGTLYQKHAGPAFAQQQLEQTAAILAQSNQPRQPSAPTPQKDMSQGALLARLQSGDTTERWEAARWLAHQWKKGDPATHANLQCVPVLLEILERHDEHTVGKAEDAAEKLTRDLELRTDEVRSAITRCLNRAKEKLASLELAFAPIRDKAVPERVTMQSRIQDYQSLVRTLEGKLRDWPSAGATAPMPPGAMAMPRPATAVKTGGGMPKALFLVLPVALLVGGVIFWRMHHASSAPAEKGGSSEHAPAGGHEPAAKPKGKH